jgi:hypothetical protein
MQQLVCCYDPQVHIDVFQVHVGLKIYSLRLGDHIWV